jgi:hypothetical protein
MIVFDLKCSGQHVFEGWFGSNTDFENQLEQGLLCCPICGVTEVGKAVMAPLVGSKSNQKEDRPSSGVSQTEPDSAQIDADSQHGKMTEPDKVAAAATLGDAEIKEALSQLAKLQEKALKSSKWVGKDFAKTALAMHYGEQDNKPIYGEVSPKDAKNLLDEGVEIAPLPLPVRRPDEEH